MKLGKVPEQVIKRSVYKQIKKRREESLQLPKVGEDCQLLKLGVDEELVMTTNPSLGDLEELKEVSVYRVYNDLLTSQAEPIGIMLTVLLPNEGRESDLRQLMQGIERQCANLNLEVLGGHTEVTTSVNRPILTMTGVGKVKKNTFRTTKGAKAGQWVVMTKWAGLQGTAILARKQKEQLLTKYREAFIDGAIQFDQYLSLQKDITIALDYGVSSLHNCSAAGVYGALWELGAASNLGMEIYLKQIPLKQETVEICEFFDLNPYQLNAGGSLLVTTDDGEGLVRVFKEEGIEAAIVGQLNNQNARVIKKIEEDRFLDSPRQDELFKVIV